jgi:hypothetical protein
VRRDDGPKSALQGIDLVLELFEAILLDQGGEFFSVFPPVTC